MELGTRLMQTAGKLWQILSILGTTIMGLMGKCVMDLCRFRAWSKPHWGPWEIFCRLQRALYRAFKTGIALVTSTSNANLHLTRLQLHISWRGFFEDGYMINNGFLSLSKRLYTDLNKDVTLYISLNRHLIFGVGTFLLLLCSCTLLITMGAWLMTLQINTSSHCATLW